MRVETGRRFAKSIACGILLYAAASACAVAPHLASITPTGGQRGNELELSFHGERLQDAVEIIAYEPGLEVHRLNLVTNQLVKATVKLSPECGLGEHHLRRSEERRVGKECRSRRS